MATISEKALSLLFPKGEIAWSGMISGSMRELSDGIAIQIERDRQAGKDIVNDFYPSTTTLQKEWEEVFRLPSGELLTKEQRAARLDAAWSRIAPGSFDGMNEIYALSGLDVIARPLQPGEDPRVIVETSKSASASLVPTFTYDTNYGINNKYGANSIYGKFSYPLKPSPAVVYNTTYGLTVYGDNLVETPVLLYDTKYGISNKYGANSIYGKSHIETELKPEILESSVYGLDSIYGDKTETFGTVYPKIFADGRPGDPVKNYLSKYGKMKYGMYSIGSRYGNFEGFIETDPILTIPDDTWTWAMIYIIESSTGDFAQIPVELKEAYEFTTYKNKPEFMWAISRVEYV